MINAESIARMKPGVRIVNCARGEIVNEADLVAALESGKVGGAALDVFCVEPLAADHKFRTLPNVVLTPHLGASSEEAQEKCGLEVAEIITAFLLTGEVRNAVNLPGVDAKTYELVKPYLLLGEKLGKLLGQLAPQPYDRLHITFGGRAQDLPQTDPVTRAILRGFLSFSAVKDINNINVRSAAASLGLSVEEKKSDEPVTFNEWLHVQIYQGDECRLGRRHVLRLAQQPAHRAPVQPAGGDSSQWPRAAGEERGPARHRGLLGHRARQARHQHRQHEPRP